MEIKKEDEISEIKKEVLDIDICIRGRPGRPCRRPPYFRRRCPFCEDDRCRWRGVKPCFVELLKERVGIKGVEELVEYFE